ncbi:MAG: DMT family transporter [Candidatus Aminicenantes bacterium]|nr:DMT family transporter [Candidatus Aminicenantes bacterium]
MTPRSAWTGILAMTATAFLWSIAGLFIKVIDWHPLTIAGFRSLIASVVVLLYLKRPHFHWSFPQVAAAVMNAVTMILFVAANKTTTSANAIVLQYIGPVTTAFVAAWLLRERPRREHWAAIVLVTAGVVVMFLDKLGGGRMLGNILALLSGVAFSFYFVFMRMQKDGSPLESILLAHWLTAAFGLAATLFVPAPRFTLGSVGAILVLGSIQVGVAAILFAAAIKRISAVTANLIAVIEPVFNPLWVFLALGEAPGTMAVAGGAVIIAAVTGVSVLSARRAARVVL